MFSLKLGYCLTCHKAQGFTCPPGQTCGVEHGACEYGGLGFRIGIRGFVTKHTGGISRLRWKSHRDTVERITKGIDFCVVY